MENQQCCSDYSRRRSTTLDTSQASQRSSLEIKLGRVARSGCVRTAGVVGGRRRPRARRRWRWRRRGGRRSGGAHRGSASRCRQRRQRQGCEHERHAWSRSWLSLRRLGVGWDTPRCPKRALRGRPRYRPGSNGDRPQGIASRASAVARL